MLPSARGVIITGFGLLIATLATVAARSDLTLWFAVIAGVLGLAAALLIAGIRLRRSPSPESAALAVAGRELGEKRETAVAQRREGEEKFRGLLDSAPDAIVIVDPDGRIVLVNTQTEKMFGYNRDELPGEPVEMLMPKRSRKAHVGHRANYGSNPGTRPMGTGLELAGRRKDGSEFPVDITLSTLETQDGVLVTSVVRDITERKRAEDELRESEERLRIIFEYAPDVYFLSDLQGNIVNLNGAAEEITGLSKKEVVGKNYIDLEILLSEDIPKANAILAASIDGKPAGPVELTLNHRNGGSTAVEVRTFPMEINGQALILIAGRDITERKQAEEELRHLAHHDGLTGLPNRRSLIDRLTMTLAQRRRKEQMVGLLFLDLDRFKVVNETAGHAAGDSLLREVAGHLRSAVREGDSVARMGGDEFTILLPEIARPEDAARIAERALAAVRRQWLVDGHEFSVTTSIGIALWPQDGDDVDTLLRNADTALYRAKDAGRDRIEFYAAGMHAEVADLAALEADLRRALQREEFVLHYQPVMDVNTGQTTGVEALVRWQHPERGLLNPMEFIPVAERTGLIVPLGEWVLRSACAQYRAWREAGLDPERLAVNFSARQFRDPSLFDMIAEILEDTVFDPRRLQIEITEQTAMDEADSTLAIFGELKILGVQIALDDFGTGHSSLAYLRRFPVDVIKIDRSFVSDVTSDPDDAAITSTIIAMAHTLGLKVIAEGIETQEQLDFLREKQCDEFQGYLFSRPIPAEEIATMLRQEGHSRVPAVGRRGQQ